MALVRPFPSTSSIPCIEFYAVQNVFRVVNDQGMYARINLFDNVTLVAVHWTSHANLKCVGILAIGITS